ncbi:MAG: hypothetical protein O3A55_02470 [Bacteroidetes bacterium]|nr:hypothetical protein [Bacteroidota bacterium]
MIFLFLQVTFLLLALHPNHVSVTDVIFNDSTKTFEISIKVIPDDFENALKKDCSTKIDILNQNADSSTFNCVENYIKKNFTIEVGKEKLNLKFLGYEFKEKEFFIYLESDKIKPTKQLIIKNEILYNNSKIQVNIIRCKIGKKDLSVRLKNPEAVWRINTK